MGVELLLSGFRCFQQFVRLKSMNWMRRILSKIGSKRSDVVKQKSYVAWKEWAQTIQPEVSFIIKMPNKSESVLRIIDKLRDYANYEIIVIDGGFEEENSA